MRCYTFSAPFRMALSAQLPVRLDSEIDARLEAAAKAQGTTKSAIIRLLAKTFVEQVVQADGTVTLPPNWAALLDAADGRSRRKTVSKTFDPDPAS